MAGSAVGGWSEAHLTLAAIRTGDIEALSVLAKIYVFCTLIDIWGRGANYISIKFHMS